MALNLLRNSRLFVSTLDNTTGFTNFNTWEIPLQSDFSFSQANETQDITVSETGATPTRGSARFNTALNPVEWSFSSYMRPFKTYTLQAGGELHSCLERIMWHGLVSPNNPDFTDGTVTECEGTSTKFHVDFTASNVHKTKTLFMYIKADNTWYKISNVQVNQAEVDFSIDNLGMITWSGFGTALAEIAAPTFSSTGSQLLGSTSVNASGVLTFTALSAAPLVGQTITISGTMSTGTIGGTGTQANTYYVIGTPTTTTATISATPGGAAIASTASTGAFTGCTSTLNALRVIEYSSPTVGSGGSASTTMTTADYIVQKYSTLTIQKNGGSTYTIPITAGSLSINNNVTFLTPETLGIVNTPIGSFTGTRDITGSLTCYLRTDALNSGPLWNELLSLSSSTVNSYTVIFKAGGAAAPYVEFNIPHAQLNIPTMDVQDLLSLNIEFKVLPYTGSGSSRVTDISAVNDMTIDYYALTETTDVNDAGQ